MPARARGSKVNAEAGGRCPGRGHCSWRGAATVRAMQAGSEDGQGAFAVAALVLAAPAAADEPGLWSVYDTALKGAKYIDLTHPITPKMPVWAGFGPQEFAPSRGGQRRGGLRHQGRRLHLREERLRGDGLPLHHRPARHPARPAGALGAGVSGDRRAAADLRHPAAGGDLDRGAGGEGPGLCAAGRRHRGLGEGARDDPGRLGRLRALGLVEGLAGPGALDPLPLPRRRPRRAEVPARGAAHPLPRPRAARHRRDADAGGGVLAAAQRLHPGRGRGEPRPGGGDRLPRRDRLRQDRRRASAGSRATWRSARRTGRTG